MSPNIVRSHSWQSYTTHTEQWYTTTLYAVCTQGLYTYTLHAMEVRCINGGCMASSWPLLAAVLSPNLALGSYYPNNLSRGLRWGFWSGSLGVKICTSLRLYLSYGSLCFIFLCWYVLVTHFLLWFAILRHERIVCVRLSE